MRLQVRFIVCTHLKLDERENVEEHLRNINVPRCVCRFVGKLNHCIFVARQIELEYNLLGHFRRKTMVLKWNVQTFFNLTS